MHKIVCCHCYPMFIAMSVHDMYMYMYVITVLVQCPLPNDHKLFLECFKLIGAWEELHVTTILAKIAIFAKISDPLKIVITKLSDGSKVAQIWTKGPIFLRMT